MNMTEQVGSEGEMKQEPPQMAANTMFKLEGAQQSPLESMPKTPTPPSASPLSLSMPLSLPKKKKTSSKNKKIPTKSKMVTGYIIYASEIRKEIIRRHPGSTFGEISKIVGAEWKELSQENKVAYEKRAMEQNELFKIEFANETSNDAASMSSPRQTEALELSMKLGDVGGDESARGHQQHQHQQTQQQVQHLDQNPYAAINYLTYQQQQQQQQQHQQQQQTNANYFSQMMGQSDSSAVDALLQFQQQPSLASQQEQPQVSQQEQSSPQQQPPQQHQQQLSQHILAQQQQQPSQQQSQQQPFQILQHQPFQLLQHQQQPISTMVQYCNNPACCSPSTGRYQPYSYPYSPPAQSITPNSLQQSMSPQSSPGHQQYPYKRNNIIYRMPIIGQRRPKDAATQTDPIKWADKIESDLMNGDKKQLKYSQKFLEHMQCVTGSPVKGGIETDSSSDSNNNSNNPSV